MYKVYLAIPLAPDKQLGYITEDGKVYLRKFGPDDRIGHVDLSTGKVYADRFGPDREVGHVDMKSGKVYTTRFGPDDYVGRVDTDGHIYRHVPLAADDYIGKVDPFVSYTHSTGAMLLLVFPAFENKDQDTE